MWSKGVLSPVDQHLGQLSPSSQPFFALREQMNLLEASAHGYCGHIMNAVDQQCRHQCLGPWLSLS
ncbi:Uncharacterised protein [Chlamydia trachomatis]|nr:Uncharacterised protein [Chlamydia trachomatis]